MKSTCRSKSQRMIHAVPCVKYCQVLSRVFEIILSSDDSLLRSLVIISYEMCQGSMLFLPGSFGANEASSRRRATSVTWHV